jgi:signal transduction histidine kinase
LNNDRSSLFSKISSIAFVVVFLVLTLILLGQVLSAKYNVVYYFSDVLEVDNFEYQVNGQSQGAIDLPATITDLQPNDEVTLTTTIEARQMNNILLRTYNARLRLYVNDSVYYTTGDVNTYPTFQKEPGIAVNSVGLPRTPEVLRLRFEYTVSDIATSLRVPAFYQGDPAMIANYVGNLYLLPFILAIVLLVLGIVLPILGLTFYRRAAPAISLFWLGLALLACGSWSFFSNELTLFLFSQYSVCYNLSYISLFIMPVPLVRFGIMIMRPYRSVVLEVIFWIMALFFVGTVVSQLTGFVCFGTIGYWFLMIAPLIITVYLAVLLFARYNKLTQLSSMYIFSNVMLLVFAIVNSFNAAFRFVDSVGLLFQIGLLFDTAVVAILVWEFLIGAFEAVEKNATLEVEVAATHRNLTLQRTLYDNFTASAEEIRKLRHDIRHQLLAVRGMLAEGKEDQAEQYIDELYGNIPSIADKLICDNIAVNALAVHYLAEAEADGIQCDVQLDVPLAVGRVPDSDLSVMVGNLFENSIEACLHVEHQKRFIKMRSNITKGRFMFTIDNSYDGNLTVKGQEFYSRKRDGKSTGIGIASVKTVVLKYDGSMKYEAQDGVFKTSLYVKI